MKQSPKKSGATTPVKTERRKEQTTLQPQQETDANSPTLRTQDEELTQIFESKILPQLMVGVRQVVRHEFHAGPIPSGKQLAEYEQACPGSSKVIIDEFQKNGEHARALQMKALVAQKSDNDWNRAAAVFLVVCSLGAILWLAHTDHDVLAGILATTTVGAVITGFLNRRTKQPPKPTPDADTSD